MAAEDDRTDAASPDSADAPAPAAGVLDDLATAATAAGTLLGALARLARAELRLAWRGVRLVAWALLTALVLLFFLLLTLVVLLVWLLLHATGSLGAGLALTALVLLLALFGARALLRLGLHWLSLPGTRAEACAALQSLTGKRDPP